LFPVACPTSTKAQRMRQLIEGGGGLSKETDSFTQGVGTLSQRLPNDISPELLGNAALRFAAPLAYSEGNKRPHAGAVSSSLALRLNRPLVREQTASHQPPRRSIQIRLESRRVRMMSKPFARKSSDSSRRVSSSPRSSIA